MASEPMSGDDLASRLERAINGYDRSWKTVDEELYALCRRRGRAADTSDAYCKVAIVGRVYAAGVARSWRGGGDAEIEIAEALSDPELAVPIESGLQRLNGQPFDRERAAEIIELHGRVARALSHRSGNVYLTSFVSKYLHFHCPIVPIYDSLAQAAIGKFVERRAVNRLIRDEFSELNDWARSYRNFVAAFVVLYERAHAETTLNPTVKELDQMLWQQT